MTKQKCRICLVDVQPSERYPRYVCESCAMKASSADGRLLEFYNSDPKKKEISLFGFHARYADTKKIYKSQECFINGVRCRADEARFGGIVIETVDGSSS